jgi:hypothetical protein
MEKLTVPEAILKSLEATIKPVNSLEVTENIMSKKYYDFAGKTPESTISGQLGEFIRKGDSRVKRFRGKGGLFYYYLSKFEDQIENEVLVNSTETIKLVKEPKKSYEERDLHVLLTTFLNSKGIFSKTIFHESSNSKDSNQIWTHPDVVGVSFTTLKSKATHQLLKVVDNAETFKISSYEIKKEINSDNELKRAFFQAVSNSSWASFGYLVTFDFSSSLMDEMARLNQSFGIGLIQLRSNPFQSRILFQPRYRDLDFSTMDKLCRMNKDFEKFIEQIEGFLSASDRYREASKRSLQDICDKNFDNEKEAEAYCQSRNIRDED